ncbi:MAG: hypothetical protein JW940_32905 [Polyangiaceae bacterium]|nr:hypothetical protein [Polyangiaceae bacterium]
MRPITNITGLAAGLAVLAAVDVALAGSMDPALERFVVNSECQQGPEGYGSYNEDFLDASGRPRCTTNDRLFKRFVNQLGFAFAPTAMHPARTTGYGGFHFSFEASYTDINERAKYWRLGTRGNDDPDAVIASEQNDDPASFLQLYSLKARKGLGFGLEVGASVGMMPQTTLMSAGGDVRLAVLEGFREGIPGYVPDIAVGGAVRTIAGTSQLQLTISSLDVQISKPIPVASSVVLSPWVGFQYLWIFGDSGTIDLTPKTDATELCNYQGDNVPGSPSAPDQVDENGEPVYDGQAICEGGVHADMNNNVVFDKARFVRQRAIIGASARYEMLQFGAQAMFDLVAPEDAQTSQSAKDELKGTPRQWTAVLEFGVVL